LLPVGVSASVGGGAENCWPKVVRGEWAARSARSRQALRTPPSTSATSAHPRRSVQHCRRPPPACADRPAPGHPIGEARLRRRWQGIDLGTNGAECDFDGVGRQRRLHRVGEHHGVLGGIARLPDTPSDPAVRAPFPAEYLLELVERRSGGQQRASRTRNTKYCPALRSATHPTRVGWVEPCWGRLLLPRSFTTSCAMIRSCSRTSLFPS
jgi:hypothetical protein